VSADGLISAVSDAFGTLGLLAFGGFMLWQREKREERHVRQGDTDAETAAARHAEALLELHRQERADLLEEHKIERAEWRQETNDLRERVVRVETRERQWGDMLQIHAGWDFTMIESMRRLDPTLAVPPAPPLYPPHVWSEEGL
jgi:hypothetical protein